MVKILPFGGETETESIRLMYIEHIDLIAASFSYCTNPVNLIFHLNHGTFIYFQAFPNGPIVNEPNMTMRWPFHNGKLTPLPVSLPALLVLILSRSFMARWWCCRSC